jgi:UDP-hydrolysing UDP-N-acetyl-D-glucosamine 2-epimerase
MIRKIAVVTGSRAEYGILRPLLQLIEEQDDLDFSLIVTGLHLLNEYGSTIDDIKADNIKIDAIVNMYDESEDSQAYYGSALARGINGFTLELQRLSPDIVVLLGDRLEPLAATLAAVFLKIPIAHLHGGDKTDSGTIDESIRHSITRFSNVHLVALSEHRERLMKMGEDPSRIHVVGSMGLDTIVKRESVSKSEISSRIKFRLDDESLLMIFHPVHHENNMGQQMNEIAAALIELKLKTIIVYPNNDIGNEEIILEIEKLSDYEFIKIVKSLAHNDYVDLIRHVSVIVGNSSSGIIEAASVNLPVVNIGSRQEARGKSENIINVDAKRESVIEAIRKSLYDKEFRANLKKLENPYGDGRTAERVLQILSQLVVDNDFMKKTITY